MGAAIKRRRKQQTPEARITKEATSGRGGRAVGGLRTRLPADAEEAPPAASWQLFWPAPKEGSRTQESRPGPDSGIRPVPDLRRMHALHIYTRATKKAKTHALTCIIQALPGRLSPDKETNGAANQENHKTIKFNYSPALATVKRGLAEYNPLMVLRRPHFLILPHYNHQGLSKFKEHDKWRS